jgi:hypothetical protein
MRRPKYLLSSLLRCAKCGSKFTLVDARGYGCAAHNQRGTCHVKLRVDRVALEVCVFDALTRHLSRDLVERLLERFYEATEETRAAWSVDIEKTKRLLADVKRKRELIVDAIERGLNLDELIARAEALRDRHSKPTRRLESEMTPLPEDSFDSRMAFKSLQQVFSVLKEESVSQQAKTQFRALFERIEIREEVGRPVARVFLSALELLKAAVRAPDFSVLANQIKLVAGTRNHLKLRSREGKFLERELLQFCGEYNKLASLFQCAA